jgi:DNA (cytosine-5)-methyltransferase 1
MRLLDLFCGAGGAGMGYQRAGFEVTGVDILPQKHYPFAFHQADALEFVAAHGHEYDVIHASPPCQGYSTLTPTAYKQQHPDMIGIVRAALCQLNKSYVIENVAGARKHLNNPILLCGSMFGLQVWRHRYFESNVELGLTYSCNHGGVPVLISGSPRRNGSRKEPSIALRKQAMGIAWMSQAELDQAIPPAYTKFVGDKLQRECGDYARY